MASAKSDLCHLLIHRASPFFDLYQITLLADYGTCVCDHLLKCVRSHEMMVGVKSQTCDFLISNHIQYLNHHTTSHIPIPLLNHAQRLFNASKHNNMKSQSHKN